MINKWHLAWIFLIGTVPQAWAQNDRNLWHAYNWKIFEKDKININLFAENRVKDNISRVSGYFLGATVRFKVSPKWTLGTGTKRIYSKQSDSFNEIQRTELEATYKLDLGRVVKFAHRNRYEYLSNEVGVDYDRYRSRLSFSVPRKGVMSKWVLSNEFFYDTRSNDFAINRLTPLSLTFKLSKRATLNTYYMWEHRRSGSRENHIFGTMLAF